MIGTVACADQDSASIVNPAWGDLRFSIIGGNVNSSFAMVDDRLVVANDTAYIWMLNYTFTLEVSVVDGGGLSSKEYVTVWVADANHNPVVSAFCSA